MLDKRQPENFAYECYRRETYVRTYSSIINPIYDQSMWIHSDSDAIMPPPLKRPSGRPKRGRKKGPNEVKETNVVRTHGTLKCGNCQQYGHNTRTCKLRGTTKGRGRGRGTASVGAGNSQTSGITLDNSRPKVRMTSILVYP
ncbi:hypothetical protein Vadar_030635 [Vaccinium darrowii]|uniref:Uncharacterized protein n=1 Tax=Vaccinium darrowii TaxID=229202 RepID=A0ACB7X5B2_9ERIC|nr:hypothetical protein Vadar_030635 [Vaccinium darrowii]